MNRPVIERTRDALRARVASWRAAGQTVGVVPTMGALHDGHLALVARAKAECDRVIVTLFVNPKQFNNPSDLEKYPRTEDSDAVKLAPLDVDVLYAPGVDQMYPAGFATTVSVAGLTDVLCGAHRPGHFDGVATIVTKLFTQTGADRAYFGEKDYQQLQVVRRMATDLDLPIAVIGCETVREADGLAMSSRNLRLSPEARTTAPALHREMRAMVQGLHAGRAISDLRAEAEARLLAEGFERVEYFDLRGAENLDLRDRLTGPARVFVAAWLGDVRLIDNIPA
ncbi:pantoate--beta-alanine ligase [Sagittula salina]|uniref:Pantothenate synthetase n=1 Tax=Sagittula salina TaxID=2820268 RepID=A0A940MNC6_9RHOB|nr:pantoate--beta-alanine ligase [Sagittula salina]